MKNCLDRTAAATFATFAFAFLVFGLAARTFTVFLAAGTFTVFLTAGTFAFLLAARTFTVFLAAGTFAVFLALVATTRSFTLTEHVADLEVGN